MADAERDDDGDPLLGRIRPRWGADRTERNLAAMLERLGGRRRRGRTSVRAMVLEATRRRLSRAAR
jgi:hypothetical protein